MVSGLPSNQTRWTGYLDLCIQNTTARWSNCGLDFEFLKFLSFAADGDRLIMKGANLTTVEMLTALGSRCNTKELKAEQKSKKKNPWRTEQWLCLHLHVLKQKSVQKDLSKATNSKRDGWNTDQVNIEQNELFKCSPVIHEMTA